MRILRRIWSISFLFSSIALLWSQAIPDGKKISSIEVELKGPQTLGKSFILQNLQVEEGIPYDGALIDKSIRNLIATGSVEDVKVFIDPEKRMRRKSLLFFGFEESLALVRLFLRVTTNLLTKNWKKLFPWR